MIDYAILAALITALVVVAVAVAGSWIYSMWTHLLPMLLVARRAVQSSRRRLDYSSDRDKA